MDFEIGNGVLTARVASRGAELKSLRFNGAEYIWQAGPEWGWSAPVCCPWCGLLRPFERAGRSYAGGRHGFAREREHTLTAGGGDSLDLALEVQPGDGDWPWPFALLASYRLDANRLELSYRVLNTGEEAMPLQFGFHPGFIAPPGSAIRAERPDIPGFGSYMPITEGSFDNDSIDLAAPASRWMRLERGDGRAVEADTSDCAHVLLWGTPGSTPFACIEPWTGYPSDGGPFERPGALALAPGRELRRRLLLSIS